jgi:hypothetical protein
MTTRIPFVSGCLSLTLLCSCTWQSESRYEFAVFSEDGEASAAVMTTYEARKRITHDDEQAYQVQVLLAEEPETSLPPAITDNLDGRVIDYPTVQLFFMRNEGYLLLGLEGPDVELDDGGMENDLWFHQIYLDGTITLLGGGSFQSHLSCKGGLSGDTLSPLRFIPSPDGTILARFEAETSCTERALQLTLLDSASETVLAGPYDVPDPTSEAPGDGERYAEVEIGWTEDDAFAVGFSTEGGGGETFDAVLYRVDSDPQTGVSLSSDCFNPPTSSSETNADEETLTIDEETGRIQIDPEEFGRAFGCED